MKHSGLKTTRCRVAILDVLEQSDQPLTASDIFRALEERKRQTSFSTVYRTLDTLADKGIVTKLTLAGEEKSLFELNRSGHKHYLICLGCKKVTALENCPLQRYEEQLRRETSYAIAGHKLAVYGYCPSCQRKK